MWFSKTEKMPKMTEQEEKMFNVISNLVTQPDCIIEVNPEDMSYMLCLEKEQYYLLVDGCGVQFSNHGFIVIRNYPGNILDAYKNLVRDETINRRNFKRNEIFKNESNLLDKINVKLNNRVPFLPSYEPDNSISDIG
jgi:hypothetical protein